MRFRMLLFVPALALMSSCGEDTKDWTPLASGELKPPHLELFADSFLFGATYVGERATDTLQVGNTGEAPLEVAISVSGNWFSVFPDTATIMGGRTAYIQVTFAPGQEGSVSDSLRIRTNEPDDPLYRVSLVGSALFRPPPPPGPPLMRVALTKVEFGNVLLGERGTQIVTVVNHGGSNLEMNISFDGDAASSPFSADPSEASIAPGDQVNVTVTFTPSDESSFVGRLLIESNDPARLRETVTLSGSGFSEGDPDPDPDPEPDPAVVSVSMSNIAFGPVLVGTARLQTFTVMNTGGRLLNASIGFNVEAGPFAVSPSTVSLTPGASKIVTVSFAPNTAGGFLAEVLVRSTGQDMSYGTVSLSGSGFRNNDPIPNPDPQMHVDASPISFGAVPVGTSTARGVLIRNTGSVGLSVEILFAGSEGPFGISSANVSVPPGEERTIQVSFSPPDESSFLAELAILGDGQLVSIPLSGSGQIAAEDQGSVPEIIQASALVNGRSYLSGARFGATVGDVVTFSLETGNAGDTVRWEQRVGTAIEPQGEGRELIYTLPNTTFILEIVAIVTNEGGAQSAVSWKIQVLAR